MKRIVPVVLSAWVLSGVFVRAQVLAETSYNLGASRTNQLSVEYLYNYSVRSYVPAPTIQFVSAAKDASFATPEGTLVAQYSAMHAGNYDWFEQTWSKPSLEMNRKQNAEKKQGADFWINIWKQTTGNRQIQLLHRIETGAYVVIHYKLIPIAGGEPPFEDTCVLTKEGSEWKVTQDLSADPVPVFWQQGADSRKLQKIVR